VMPIANVTHICLGQAPQTNLTTRPGLLLSL
jgi:hypothetical protein